MASAVATLPAMMSTSKLTHIFATVSMTLRAVAVGGVDDDHVSAGGDECLHSLQGVETRADGGGNAEPAAVVLGGPWVVDPFLDVLHRYEAVQGAVRLDYRELLDTVTPSTTCACSSVVPTGAVMRPVDVMTVDTGSSRRPSLCSTKRRSRFVTIPTKRPESSTTGTPDTWNSAIKSIAVAIVVEGETVIGFVIMPDSDRFTVDLGGLIEDGEVAVYDPDPALASHRDGKARLGDRVHRGGDERDGERDASCEAAFGGGFGGKDLRRGRDEQNVVEGEALRPNLA